MNGLHQSAKFPEILLIDLCARDMVAVETQETIDLPAVKTSSKPLA